MKYFRQNGFTLVELLVAVAISGLVASAIIGFFIAQQRSHTAQEQVTYMQQNIRAGLGIMSRELRMAGYNPNHETLAFFEIPVVPADRSLARITFKMDLDGNGDFTDPAETFTYSFNAGSRELHRVNDGNDAIIAEGIDGLAFAYGYDTDNDGVLDGEFSIVGDDGLGAFGDNWHSVDPDTGVISAIAGPVARAEDIRAVKIWLLSGTDAGDLNFTDTTNHYQEHAWPGADALAAIGDNQRRRALVTEIGCRNMGL